MPPTPQPSAEELDDAHLLQQGSPQSPKLVFDDDIEQQLSHDPQQQHDHNDSDPELPDTDGEDESLGDKRPEDEHAKVASADERGQGNGIDDDADDADDDNQDDDGNQDDGNASGNDDEEKMDVEENTDHGAKQKPQSFPPPSVEQVPKEDQEQQEDEEQQGEEEQQEKEQQDEEEDLFTKLTNNPSNISALVTEWFARVQKNGPHAVADLLSLIVRFARPPASPPYQLVTSSMVMKNNPKESVEEITNIIRQDVPGVVPILAKDASSRKTKRVYEEFWRRLGSDAPPAILFDTDCHETLISWFGAMAVAQIRTLRLSACVGVYRMVDGFIEYGNRLRNELKSMQKQLQTEKKKCGLSDTARGKGKRQSPRKALSEKGTDLMNKVETWTTNISDLTDLADRVFQHVVIIKYRDIYMEIRALTITTLGGWILSDPIQFLDDQHSKYIGWLLSDKDAVVRRTSLEILSKLAQKSDFFPSSADFFQRFAARITEMTIDKDDSVAVQAIHLCRHLSRYEALPEASYELICDIAIEGPATNIRRAAGHFLINMLYLEKGWDDDDDDGVNTSGRKRNSKKKSAAKRRRRPKTSNPFLPDPPTIERSIEAIKELLFAVTRKENIEEVGAELAVDAVWDHMPALRNWDAFLAILSEKEDQSAQAPNGSKQKSASKRKAPNPEEDNTLSDDDKAILCEMLLASAREASGSGDPYRKQQLAICEFSETESPAALLSATFLPELTGLLVKYQADIRALSALVQLPIYFHLGSVEQERNEKHFEEVVLKLIDIMSRYTGSPDLINVCANTFKALTTSDTALKKLTLTSLQLGCSNAAKDLTLLVRADLSQAEPVSVAAAVLRIKVMSELVQPNTSVHASIVKLLEYQIDHSSEAGMGDDVTADAIRTSCALMFWSLRQIRTRLETSKEKEASRDFLSSEEGREIQEKCTCLISLICRVCASDSFSVSIRMVSLRSLLTTLVCVRGVERHASVIAAQESPEGDDEDEENQKTGLETADLLNLVPKLDELATTVKSCVIAVVKHQLSRPIQSPSGKNRRASRKITDISEESVRDCFTSLVQCSFQSILSDRITQLPMLGLLLKEKKSSNRHSASWPTYDLCKHYCRQHPYKKTSRIKEEILALTNAVELAETDEDHSLVRELALHILSLRAPGSDSKKAAADLLLGLMNNVLNSETSSENLSDVAIALVQGGLAFVEHLGDDEAKSILEKAKEVEVLLNEHSSIPTFFDMLFSAIEAVSKKERPEVPKLVPARMVSKARGAVTKKRRRPPKDPSTYFSSSQVDAGNVRRSGRDRKKVNYAKLGGMSNGDESEEESSGAEASAEESEESEGEGGGDTEPSTAAEVGKQLMSFSSSPRVPQGRKWRGRGVQSAPRAPPPLPLVPAAKNSRTRLGSKRVQNGRDGRVEEEEEEDDEGKGKERSGDEKSDGGDLNGKAGDEDKQGVEGLSASQSGRIRKPSAKLREVTESSGVSPLKSGGKMRESWSHRNEQSDSRGRRRGGDVQSSQELTQQPESPVPVQQSPQQSPPVRRSKRESRKRSYLLEEKENIDEMGHDLAGRKRSRGSMRIVARKKHKKW